MSLDEFVDLWSSISLKGRNLTGAPPSMREYEKVKILYSMLKERGLL